MLPDSCGYDWYDSSHVQLAYKVCHCFSCELHAFYTLTMKNLSASPFCPMMSFGIINHDWDRLRATHSGIRERLTSPLHSIFSAVSKHTFCLMSRTLSSSSFPCQNAASFALINRPPSASLCVLPSHFPLDATLCGKAVHTGIYANLSSELYPP